MDEYKQSPRIENVHGDATYHFHEAPRFEPKPPRRRGAIWGAVIAAVAASGNLVTTQLNARTVYYCASHNSVKYHTDATCAGLKQCGAVVKSMPLGQAKDKMEPCKKCPK